MMTHKEKVIKYLKHKEISQDKFSRVCDVSSGFLRQGKSFSIDFLPKIRDNYPDLNLNWLIYNEGNMLLTGNNIGNKNAAPYYTNSNCEKQIVNLQSKLIEIQDALIESQQLVQEFQKMEIVLKKYDKSIVVKS